MILILSDDRWMDEIEYYVNKIIVYFVSLLQDGSVSGYTSQSRGEESHHRFFHILRVSTPGDEIDCYHITSTRINVGN